MTAPLDDLDRKIIDVLERDGRATLAQVGDDGRAVLLGGQAPRSTGSSRAA